MANPPLNRDLSFLGKLRSGIGGLATIFATAMTAITALILGKPHFSDELFVLTLAVIFLAGAGATIYLFCYGLIERMLKSVDKTQQHITELTKERRALIAMNELTEMNRDQVLSPQKKGNETSSVK